MANLLEEIPAPETLNDILPSNGCFTEISPDISIITNDNIIMPNYNIKNENLILPNYIIINDIYVFQTYNIINDI